MAADDPLRKIPPEPDPSDDIEILEVVGLDEDGAPVVSEEDADEAGADDVEVVFEDAAPEGGLPAPASPPEDAVLRERILRLQADFDNFKKRIERERLDHLRHATGDLVTRLLPVLDNFERAVASARPGGSDPVLHGVLLIHKQFLDELKKEGLRPMDGVGEPFDPTLHEAVATDPDAAAAPNTVTHVFQRGYFFHDRVLRPALVRVSVDVTIDAIADGGTKES
jgi:molecular chaperone GrpE